MADDQNGGVTTPAIPPGSAQAAAAIAASAYRVDFRCDESDTAIAIRPGWHVDEAWAAVKALAVLCHYADVAQKTVAIDLTGSRTRLLWPLDAHHFKAADADQICRRLPRSPGRPPVVAGADDYHRGLFHLPVDKIAYYDDPSTGLGDDGWDVAGLIEAIGRDGQRMEIAVGRSLWSLAHDGDDGVAAFNGNHRLAACRALGLTTILCSHSDADDADPLTRADILELGGQLV